MRELKSVFFAVLFLFSLSFVFAESAHRSAGRDWTEYSKNYFSADEFKSSNEQEPITAVDAASDFESLDLDKIQTVHSVTDSFKRIRDYRNFTADTKPGFFRRLSWLYPADGCWVRAELASSVHEMFFHARVQKLFIFGNLVVKTKNFPGGQVGWWYHVAPIASDKKTGIKYIMDPAIDPNGPLALEDWILKQVPQLEDAQLSICSPNTYGPGSSCEQSQITNRQSAEADLQPYLDAEWDNLLQLERIPEEELGEKPPWLLSGLY